MNNNVNLVKNVKKKKNRRKKKQFIPARPPVPTVDPAATLQGLKTIANLIQIHQQLTLTGHKPSNNYNPKPLMSEPRLKKSMFSWQNTQSKFGRQLTNLSSESTSTSSTKTIPTTDTSENVTQDEHSSSDVQNNQNLQSQSVKTSTKSPMSNNLKNIDQTSINDQTKIDQSKKSFDNQEKLRSHTVSNVPTKSNKTDNNQFDDFEIYNSPSFINFETTEVVELNDDDINLNRSIDTNMTQNNDKEKTVKKIIPTNFKTKLQTKKKFERQNLTQIKTTPISLLEDPNNKHLQATGQDEAKKKANKELLDGLSSDIKTVIQDSIKSNDSQKKPQDMHEPGIARPFLQHIRLEPPQQPTETIGIERPFLQQIRLEPPQQPTETNLQETQSSSNIPRPVQCTTNQNVNNYDSNLFVETQNVNTNDSQVYSPTDIYQNIQNNEVSQDGSESPDVLESGNKRVSAFQRLGPLSQPKKPKLTINLSLNKEQAVREVVDESYLDIPVHDRDDINQSTDEIVVKYLPYWPWKKTVALRKKVTARISKTVMMMEKEQMEEVYDRDSALIMILVKGYPPTWTKEQVLDVLLENLKGKSFIPCFIEFTTRECKFFVIRSREALLYIHGFGFVIKTEDVELRITIAQTLLSVKQIDFIPRLVLRKRLASKYNGEKLDLSEFTLKKDISHFIYFPLNREFNQFELVQLHSDVAWERLTELDLSYNRITTIKGFNLQTTTPHLKVLNLSHNNIDSVLVFLPCRNLPLKTLMLDGNPVCLDYIDPDHYVKVMRMIFPGLRELDGVSIKLKGDFPIFKKSYCPEDAEVVIERFLEVFFPLLDAEHDKRLAIQNLYSKKAVLTITCKNKLRYDSACKLMRKFAIKCQNLLEGNLDTVEGVNSIGKLIKKWPLVQHDPTTFTTDVMFHDDSTTIFNITGILKIRAESLAEDEPLLSFSRTIVLSTKNGCKYKIQNEMLYWDEPTEEFSRIAFKSVLIPRKTLSLKFETTPDDNTKIQLVNMFMKVTELDKKASEKCLESKNWHFQHALEYFIKLLKLDNIQTLTL
ncbi:unnamed protein product [Euphydryas editha]|uniref:NTF2 domain-containing protein n=1 Tax=Euphydryas editha TaxID=104508 RepID=A0AAU9TXP9_EUPED|nr:unnamed protein product [Euphydryas editha]